MPGSREWQLQWLLNNDPEGAKIWIDAYQQGRDLSDAIRDIVRDFPHDEDVREVFIAHKTLQDFAFNVDFVRYRLRRAGL